MSVFIFILLVVIISLFVYQYQSVGVVIGFLLFASAVGVVFSEPLFAVSLPFFGVRSYFSRPFYFPNREVRGFEPPRFERRGFEQGRREGGEERGGRGGRGR